MILRAISVCLMMCAGASWSQSPAPGSSTPLESALRDALVERDFDRLETVIAEAQAEGRKINDYDSIRFAYRRIFATTHPERELIIKEWVVEHPGSAYAWTALAEMQYWQSQAYLGWSYRWPRPLGDTVGQLKSQGYLSALKAQSLDPSFARSTQLALMLTRDNDIKTVERILAPLVKKRPEHFAFAKAAVAVGPPKGGSLDASFEICAKYAPLIKGYDADICMVEMITDQYLEGELFDAAIKIVSERDSPYLSHFKLDAKIAGPTDLTEAEEVFELQRMELGRTDNLTIYIDKAQIIFGKYQNPLYMVEASAAVEKEILKRLKDDPRNPWLMKAIRSLPARDILPIGFDSTDDRISHEEFGKYWLEGLAFGYQIAEYWFFGAEFLNLSSKQAVHPADIIEPYNVNALILSGHSFFYAESYLKMLIVLQNIEVNNQKFTVGPFRKGTDETTSTERYNCPIARAARLMQILCQQAALVDGYCDKTEHPYTEVPTILKVMEAKQLCPEVMNMSITELPFTTLLPIPEFDQADYGP